MPGLRDRKTPGVYITEIPAFPPSAVGIDTAVPAFVGYTEKAEIRGRSVELLPVKINSLKEFDDIFGGPPKQKFEFEAGTKDDFDVKYDEIAVDDTVDVKKIAKPVAVKGQPGASETNKPEAPGKPTPYKKLKLGGEAGVLHRSLQLFYANGGSTCFIVSVGPYKDAVASDDLLAGVLALEDQVGPTMILVPDLSLLPIVTTDGTPKVDGFKPVAIAMLNQCKAKLDRVALLDVVHAQGIDRKSPIGSLDKAIEQFRADVDSDNRDYGIAYFPYLDTSIVRPADLNFTWFESDGFSDLVLNQAVNLFPDPQLGEVQTAVKAVKSDFIALVAAELAVEKAAPDSDEPARAKTALEAAQRGAGRVQVEEALQALDPKIRQKLDFLYHTYFPAGAAEHKPAEVKPVAAKPGVENAAGGEAAAAKPVVDKNVLRKNRDNNLTNMFPALPQLYAMAAKKLNRLPATAAMAGVMTFTDNARGVWNAPANISLVAVDAPALVVNDITQGDLNKPLDGKAINVIREFIGRGPVVWGARTLDGNSNDYRYVQVRRTLIYMEQSIKTALNQYVFAANDGRTWVNAVSMVSNFLHDLWAKGGLMGATAKDAFSVDCGLGTTMSGRDILEGYMIVRVLVQMVHPAEFIELTFKQKMENMG